MVPRTGLRYVRHQTIPWAANRAGEQARSLERVIGESVWAKESADAHYLHRVHARSLRTNSARVTGLVRNGLPIPKNSCVCKTTSNCPSVRETSKNHEKWLFVALNWHSCTPSTLASLFLGSLYSPHQHEQAWVIFRADSSWPTHLHLNIVYSVHFRENGGT